MNYICLVLVKFSENGKRYLFRAPAWCILVKGDCVKVEGTDDVATVLDVCNVGYGSDVYNMIVDSARANGLKKVKSKLTYTDFNYDEEGDEKHE